MLSRSFPRRTASVRSAVRWYESPWRILANALSLAFTIALVAVVGALFLIPRLLGGSSLTVLTGSMEPTFMPGDMVAVRGVAASKVCTSIGVGDIVTYLPQPGDPALITHRVVGKTIGNFKDGTDCRLIFQGDNNSAADPPVSPAQVRGRFMYGIPKLGLVRQYVVDHRGTVIIGAALLLLCWWAWDSMRPPRTRVVTMGGPPSPAPPPAPVEPPDGLAARGMALRARELEIREREIAVREAELELRTHQHRGQEAPATVKESG